MNIYIEGPDAVGKTHLARWLRNYHEFAVWHLTADTPNDFDFHKRLIEKTDWTVYDRFCLGEVVYSELYGRVPKITLEQCDELVKWSVEKGIFVLMTTSNVDILIQRLIERKEFKYLPEMMDQVRLYDQFRRYESPRFLVYDVANGYDALYKKIGEMIDGVQ